MRVHLHNSDYISGLFRLGVEFDQPTPLSSLELSFEGLDSRYALDVSNVDTREVVWIAVCSHLLSDGENVVEVSAANDETTFRESANFTVSNKSALAGSVKQSLQYSNAPVVLGQSVDSSQFNYSDQNLTAWFDRPEAKETIDSMTCSTATQQKLHEFVDQGYVVFDGLLEDDLLKALNDELDTVVSEQYQGYKWGDSQRLHDLHAHYPAVNRLWNHPGVMSFLEIVFGSRPRPCQTLTYIFGSQQRAHQDTVHLTPFPAGYMCGVWVALEDVREGSGELVVYPGSHRAERVYLDTVGCSKVSGDETQFVDTVVEKWDELLAAGAFNEYVYRPKAGDVLIWHENLMHAGSPRLNPELSRKSIVSHVFADGCIAYYDSSGAVASM